MSRILLGPISAVLILALSGCAGLTAGAEDEPDAGGGRQAATSTRAQKPTPEPTKPPLELADLLGSDGRLTVLILGSDARESVIGARTDTIIVATIDPSSGKVAMVSLPRDTVNVPIAPGQVYPGRINSLFWEFERASGKTGEALKKTKQALAYAFGIEIDYYALLEFDGLVRLVNGIGGVKVKLDEPLIDSSMRLGGKGLRLKAGARLLDGKTALAFARSRHSDSDYERSARQQQVISAAAEKVRARGIDALPSLVELVRKKVVTDIPLRAAPALYQLAMKAKLANPKSVVLAPNRWARQLPGSYTITPRVLEVQKLFDRLFKPSSG
jgi:polyisoprenyl-teichoic acid--peptidoglycan teichoic acid transferase